LAALPRTAVTLDDLPETMPKYETVYIACLGYLDRALAQRHFRYDRSAHTHH
jgi:hypothetical protein